ncbi:HDOD domain-containing protein [bacterium]|nr:HDOD domain-containing protein [bacterium]
MSLAQIQSFVGYLRQHKIFEQADIIRIVKQMVQLDRRIGLLAVSRGYMKPEQVNVILHGLLQRIDLKFGEAAVQMEFMTAAQVDELLKLQANDLFLFAQAAIIQKAITPEKMSEILKEYLKTAPQPDDPATGSKEGTMSGRKMREVLKNVQSVAALPGPAQKVLAMLQDPEVDIDKVAKLISAEPTLVATILKVVNSAFYGLRAKVNTISQAMVVLGLKKIRQIILTAGVMQKFQDIPVSQALKIWDHSITAGQWAKEIGLKLTFKDTEEMFISGLVHNVGELIILQYFPSEYRQIQANLTAGKSQVEAERQVLGGTHADLAGFVFETWQLSADTVQSAMYHHHPVVQLAEIKTLSKHAVILNLAVALADIECEDSFEIMARAEILYDAYKPLLGNIDVDFGPVFTRVESGVKELKRIFA